MIAGQTKREISNLVADFNASACHGFRLYRPAEKAYFLKPKVTQAAARAYGFDFQYRSKLSRETYASLLEFAETIRRDLADLKPRDMIDVQPFVWVLGSDEYR